MTGGPSLRARLRRLGFGLSTVLGLGPRGFFIPYRYADRIARPQPAYAAVARLFEAAAPAFTAHLDAIDGLADDLLAIRPAPPPAPRWDQGWFPTLDAAALYAMIRRFRPARVVEIGSGHSTRFAARAVADGGLATAITAVDPAPRRALDGLGVAHIAATLQDADPRPIDALGPGDILFVDSSHILMPGSDLDHLLNRVLPRLVDGVLVHVHDIFLPEDYPAAWWWRGYNEQSAIAALLLSGGWQPLFASRYVLRHWADRLGRGVLGQLPAAAAPASSLWMVRRSTE